METKTELPWIMPSRQCVLGFIGAWAVFFTVLASPVPNGLTPAAMHTLAVVLWSVIIWVTEAVPVGVTGLVIPMLLFITGALPKMEDAFAGYVASTTYLCLGAFMFAALMQLSGLDKRIAVVVLNVFKVKKADELVKGMFVTNFILSLLIPATAARGTTLLPIVKGLIDVFGDSPPERRAKSAIVIQSMVYSTMICGVVVMTAHMPNILMVNLFEKKFGYSMGYLQWFWLHAPMLLLWVLIYHWTKWFFKTKDVHVEGGVERIGRMRQAMGKSTPIEKLLLGFFCVTAVSWATSKPLFGLDVGTMTIVMVCIIFIPGLLPWKWNIIQKNTTWGTFLFLAGAMSLSVAMSKTGLAQYLAGLAQPLAMGQHWSVALLILMLVTHVIRIGMLSNVAAIAFLAPVMADLAGNYGYNPIPFTLLVCDVDTFAFIIPTQVTVGVLAYSSKAFTMKDYALSGLGTMAIAIVFDIAVMAPWYALNGLPLTP
jgi:solute carrier family 13 (sodium-dependent dicarboxylate transporter), member 2/3/5